MDHGAALVQPAATITYSLNSSETVSFTGTGTTYTLTEAVALYDLITVQWVMDNVGSAVVPSITDSVSGAYSIAGSAYYYSAGNKSFGQSVIGCTAAATPVITVSAPSALNGQLLINHFSGFTGPPTLDQAVSTTGTGTSIANSATTGYANELALTNTFAVTANISGTPSGMDHHRKRR